MKILHASIILVFFVIIFFSMQYVSAQTNPPPNDLGDGNVFNLKAKNMELPGGIIEISGNLVTKDPIKIMLSDPNGTIVNSATTFSDRNGDFTSELKMPTNPTEGTWRIIGTSGVYKNYIEFDIHSSASSQTQYCCMQVANQTQTRTNSTDPASYGGFLTKINSPLKQFQFGIAAKDVKCKQGLQFIMKNENGQPACVTPNTFDGLITRGWGIIPLGGLPTSYNASYDVSIDILYNGTRSSLDNPFYLKQGQNVTLILDVKSDPANVPVTLYTAQHSGFTKTNGIDFKLSDTRVIAPAKVMMYVSVSKDATPSTYGAAVKGNTTNFGNTTYLFFVTVK